MNIKRSEVKITIAKLVELAYSKDKGLTTQIMAEKGVFKLTVDQYGNAVLNGKSGILTFSGKAAVEQLGVTVRRLSINFNNVDGMKVSYTASVDLKIASFSFIGSFDVSNSRSNSMYMKLRN